MNELFPYQWESKAGEILTEDKKGYSDNFLVWCDKTKLLTVEEWKTGVERVEQDIVKNTSIGEKNYPPSYAEFIGLCKPTISPDGTNSGAYIQYKPENRIESDEYVSKRKKAGRMALDEMLGKL